MSKSARQSQPSSTTGNPRSRVDASAASRAEKRFGSDIAAVTRCRRSVTSLRGARSTWCVHDRPRPSYRMARRYVFDTHDDPSEALAERDEIAVTVEHSELPHSPRLHA